VRLLLDEMLSPAIARELRARGHDVQAVAEHPDRAALPDPEVMTLARAERRAVVTNNVRDFRPLHAEAITPGGPGHFGMIFMSGNDKRTKNDIGRIVAALGTKLAQYPGDEDLANAEDWL
jgi:predicted nuclease of predicted toxin-antitoxin system